MSKAETPVPPGLWRFALWTVLALTIAAGLAFLAARPFLNFLLTPATEILQSQSNSTGHIAFKSPQEAMAILVRSSLFLGVGLVLPVVAYQLWRALKRRHQPPQYRRAIAFSFTVTAAYWIGFSIAHWSYTPNMLSFYWADGAFNDVVSLVHQWNFRLRQALTHSLSNIAMFGGGLALLSGFGFWYFERGKGHGRDAYRGMDHVGTREDVGHWRWPNDSDQGNST